MPLTIQASAQGYGGLIADGFITKMLFSAETIKRGGIYVKGSVKPKIKIRRLTASNTLQAYQVTPTTSQATINIDGVDLIPQKCMTYVVFDPTDFDEDWLAVEQNSELIDLRLPATYESFVTQQILQSSARDYDKGIWVNNSATSGDILGFDGIIPKLVASSETTKVASPVSFTVSNIVDKMNIVYETASPLVRQHPLAKMYMNYKTQGIYRQALTALTTKGVDPTQMVPNVFAGVNIMALPWIPDDCIVLAIGGNSMDSNLWMGVKTNGSTPVEEGVSVKFMPLQNNSEAWFLKAIYAADVNVGWPVEAVLYKV